MEFERSLKYLKSKIGHVIENAPSKAGNFLKPKLIHVESGVAVMEVIVREEMCNGYGKIHGGMMTLIADECIGWALFSLDNGQFYTSVNLTMDFLYAADPGEKIQARAEVVRVGKRISYVNVGIFNEEDVLLAKCTSNLIVTNLEAL